MKLGKREGYPTTVPYCGYPTSVLEGAGEYVTLRCRK